MSALRLISLFNPVKQVTVSGICVQITRRNTTLCEVKNRHNFSALSTALKFSELEHNQQVISNKCLCIRNMSTEMSPVIKKQSIFSKIRNVLFDPPLLVPKSSLLTTGHMLYFCITEQVDFQYYIKEFDLPDTLNSYFILVILHIWLCTVRLSTLGTEGEIVRNSLVIMMWEDIEEKGKAIVQAKSSITVNQALEQYSNTMMYIFLSLDEGLLSDDKTLAGAVWRTVYEKRDVDPEKLELLVYYIRKQIHHIEKIDSFKLLSKGVVQFLNIHGDKVNDRFLRIAKQQQQL